jgi:glycosyltransferase involved in cell wall biosynthesis
MAIESVNLQTFQDFEIIVDSTENVPMARNNAIKKAKGEYILCLDADDYLDSDFLEKTVGKGDIVATGWRNFETDTIETIPTLSKLSSFLEGNRIIISSLFKKSVWKQVGGFRDMGYEDWDFWVRCLREGFEITLVPEVLVNVRVKDFGRNRDDKLNHDILKSLICG